MLNMERIRVTSDVSLNWPDIVCIAILYLLVIPIVVVISFCGFRTMKLFNITLIRKHYLTTVVDTMKCLLFNFDFRE
jgi:hypothetical protein